MRNKIIKTTYLSPIGALELAASSHALAYISFVAAGQGSVNGDNGHNPHLEEAKKQLDEYFSGKRKIFSLTLDMETSGFNSKIWQMLANIGYGQTVTYGELAAGAQKPGAARAVGNACNRNPFPIVIPCHRVLGRNGSLTGYAGGIENKKWLLAHEMALACAA